MIVFACARCAKPYRLKPEFAGRTTQCSGCKEPLVVPQAPASVRDRIAFACRECGMKFSVPSECAGRATRCPTCKEALTVPRPDETLAEPPAAGQIDGAPSSLARAGVDAAVSLTADSGAAGGTWQRLLDAKAHDGARYVVESEIARGGMGAVMRAVDRDIRREVAVKYLLDQGDAGKKLRFVEEAQITGQLEHPNIVPIHELGVDAQQRIFFAMKMVKGRSLAQILNALREEPQTAEKEYALGKLLGIFTNICNALAYAHARGVVHRDLKPANIMVGDFGEVYVMDWGLAKVLKRTTAAPVLALPVARFAEPTASPFDFAATAPLAAPVAPAEPASGSTQVVTSRESEADLTQDGAVVGTPVYMPPEQAAGQLANIDERSDVYAMGAILYELLTLQPPISKEGGYWPILLRVTQGQITPPELKDPQRTRAGKVPAELAAVAMKALAKRKQDRYETVVALRRDLELYLEGRSVSALQDSKREQLWKLVKRNKGLSAGVGLALLVLLVSLVVLGNAYLATQRAYAAFQQEQAEKHKRTRQAVPAFVEASRLAAERRRFANALEQVNLALDYDPAHDAARLLKGQLLIVNHEFGAAARELDQLVRRRPADVQAKRLLALCRAAQPAEVANLLQMAEVFERQKLLALADGLLSRHGANSFEARAKLLDLYRQRIETAWPGLGGRLTLDDAGIYCLDLNACKQVTLLDPLEGMPLTVLVLDRCSQVRDLLPLKGMPLKRLSLLDCVHVSDLSPLQGMPLTWLGLDGCSEVRDLSPLKGMAISGICLGGCPLRDLSLLQGMPLKHLRLPFDCDLSQLKGMPLIEVRLSARMRGMEVLRQIKTLETIEPWTFGGGIRADAFWKKYDAGELKGLEWMP